MFAFKCFLDSIIQYCDRKIRGFNNSKIRVRVLLISVNVIADAYKENRFYNFEPFQKVIQFSVLFIKKRLFFFNWKSNF